MKKIVFIGANNPETLRMMRALEKRGESFQYIGFIDNDPVKRGALFAGLRVFGGYEEVPRILGDDIYFVNLITRDCITRFETSRRVRELGGKFTNFVHPSVNLEEVSLGVGNYFQENVVVQAEVSVGNNTSIHMGSLIGHETTIGHSVFIAHGCNVSGLVRIEDAVFLGTGVSTLPRITIGKFSIVGAGSVVISDVPPYSVVVGNPARVIRRLEVRYDQADIF